MEAEVTVAERLRLRLGELTHAERKVARALMADYPVGGLDPVAKLAAAAGVSAPTVVRLVAKLGFDGYAEFQQSLKSEVSVRLSSPLQMHAELLHVLKRHPDARDAATKASTLYRGLVASRPDVYLPSLASALGTLARVLNALRQPEEALSAAQESTDPAPMIQRFSPGSAP